MKVSASTQPMHVAPLPYVQDSHLICQGGHVCFALLATALVLVFLGFCATFWVRCLVCNISLDALVVASAMVSTGHAPS
jgi:hypothetical protein